MNLLPPGHRNTRGAVFTGIALAAVACGVASTSVRPAATGRDSAAHPAAGTPADAGIVIEQGADGHLESWVDLPNGEAMMIMGPTPGTGRTGIVYNYPGHVGQGANPRSRAEHFATVTAVAPNSPASRAGLRAGDELLSVNGVDGRDPGLLPNKTPGTAYTLRVRRGNEEQDAWLVVGPAVTRREAEQTIRASAACMWKAASAPGTNEARRSATAACILPY